MTLSMLKIFQIAVLNTDTLTFYIDGFSSGIFFVGMIVFNFKIYVS